MHISDRDVSEKNKKCLYPEEDFFVEAHDGAETPVWMWQVSNVVKMYKARDGAFFAGRTRTHRLDLELLSWAALMWSCRCPSSALHSSVSYCICASKTRLSTTISPLHLPPIPRKSTYLFQNRAFPRSTAWSGSLSCPFLIFHS